MISNQGDKMKDIKIFLIGFLTCTCLFLIMGQGKGKGQKPERSNGRFQGFAVSEDVVFLFNIHSGETWKSSNGQELEKVLYKLNKKDK